MAIIDEFTANILVNGQPCKEYGEEYGEGAESGRGPKKVIKYIEAISGAPYNISFEVSPLFEFTTTAIAFKISIDGYLEHQECIRPHHRGIRHKISRIPAGARNLSFSFIEIKRSNSNLKYSGWELANLLSEAKGQDTLDPYISDDRLKPLGTILVEFYRDDVPEQTPVRMPAEPSDVNVLPAQRKIPVEKLEELDLTCLTHSTRFVESKSSNSHVWVHGSHVDKCPLVAFEFKYCSSPMLQTPHSIPIEVPFRLKTSMEEPLNMPKIQQPNIELPIRPSTHPLQKPSTEEPLNSTKIQEPNIQTNQDVSIEEGPNTTVIGRRKREHRDEEESEGQMGKSRKRSKAFKPSDPSGEDDKGGRRKS